MVERQEVADRFDLLVSRSECLYEKKMERVVIAVEKGIEERK